MKLFSTPSFFHDFISKYNGKRIVDLGCGARKFPGALGIDIMDCDNVDIIHDLDIFPYPLESESCDAVIINHVVEHLSSLPPVIKEVHRILVCGGCCWIATPHFTDADSWADPTHKYHFSIRSMDGFRGLFDIKLAYVTLKGRWKEFGYEKWINADGVFGKTGRRIGRWEAKHCFSRRGGEMYFVLEKIPESVTPPL